MQPASPPPHRSRTVVVVAGGDPPLARWRHELPPGAWVVAADSGVDHARALGWPVDLAVGDFDSISPEGRAALEADGTAVDLHPAAKDHTDLELALQRAAEAHPDAVIVVGGHGGRLDHLLANAGALTSPVLADVAQVGWWCGPARLHVVRPDAPVRLVGEPGEVVTLLAVHGPAGGVRTEGLTYPLHGETLGAGSSRGVSNVLAGRHATVSVDRGVVLAVLPGEAD